VTPDYLPEHGAEFNSAMTMKVSIPMFWTLKSSGTCPYQAINHVENRGGGTATSLPPCASLPALNIKQNLYFSQKYHF
jgi:hypothetical protein